jgi:hypothetical protein
LVVVGALAVLAGAALWGRPGTRQQFAPQCPPAVVPGTGVVAAKDCVASVDADGSALVITLISVGVFLVVLAANGRRLTSLRVGLVEASSETAAAKAKKTLEGKGGELDATEEEKKSLQVIDVAKTVAETQPVASAVAQVTVDNKDLDVFSLPDVPTRVVADLLLWLQQAGRHLPPSLDVEFIARRTGRQGNHPWLIKFRGLPDTFRVSYGGQGKTGPTISVV